MTLQAVFFDMGGTIETLHYTPQMRLEATPGIHQRLLSAGINLHLNNEQLFEVISNGLVNYHRWRLQRLEELLPSRVWTEFIFPDYPVDSAKLVPIAEDLMQYIETHYYQREMRPEIPAVLEAIRQMGLKIGLISNVCSKGQVPASLQRYGIQDCFDPVVLSSEYGRRKPDPAIFHYAARLAKVPTSACVHVGDRVARDISGARRAGFRLAIQIRHHEDHGEADTGASPHAIIDHMGELVDILKVEIAKDNEVANIHQTASSKVRALLFDAGDILYHRPDKEMRLAQFFHESGLNSPQILSETKKNLARRAYQGLISQDQYREELLRLYGVKQPHLVERGKRLLEEEDQNIRIFEGVKETLKALKADGYLLGIITDTALPISSKLGWFERAGFGDVWDSFISSREIGVCKPDPFIYHAALNQLHVHPGEAVFVGHDAAELDGARSVGMRTVAINYNESAKADVYIQQLSELLSLPFHSQPKVESDG